MAPELTADYKKLKEEFVSGLAGGDVTEICYVTGVAPVYCTIYPISVCLFLSFR